MGCFDSSSLSVAGDTISRSVIKVNKRQDFLVSIDRSWRHIVHRRRGNTGYAGSLVQNVVYVCTYRAEIDVHVENRSGAYLRGVHECPYTESRTNSRDSLMDDTFASSLRVYTSCTENCARWSVVRNNRDSVYTRERNWTGFGKHFQRNSGRNRSRGWKYARIKIEHRAKSFCWIA